MTDFLINSTSLDQSLNTGLGELTNQTNINHIIAENCGDRTFDVYERVAQIQMLAESALDNARLYGVNSRFGFKAMFKMNEAQAAVVAMLDHICSFRGKANLRPRPDTLSSPRVSCVTEDSVKLYDYLNLGYDPWQRCLVGGPRSTPIQGFYAEETIYTFLCPALFVQPPMSKRNHCPSVTDNTFSGDSGVFYQNYQTYIMLYQFIRFYLGNNALTMYTDPREQLSWNDCVHLNTLDSVLNPTNLQIYIACKQIPVRDSIQNLIHRLIWMYVVVSQHCTSWPNPFAPPFYPSHRLGSNLTLISSPLSSIPSDTLLHPISTQTHGSASILDLPNFSNSTLLLPDNLSISGEIIS